jgi:hypothetical protein
MRHFAGALLCAFLSALPGSVAAEPAPALPALKVPALSARDRAALGLGKMVSRPLRFAQGGGQYVGGVSYQLVDARPDVVLSALSDVTNWPDALPRTKSARLLDSEAGVSRVELVQVCLLF